ncbi:MAG: MFS transporter [Chloroflexota bacterium]
MTAQSDTQNTAVENSQEGQFQTAQVSTIAFGHFVHDIFSSGFIPTLLPILREKLLLNYEQAGFLAFCLQAPGILNPLIGYMADKVNLRYFVILAPAVSATLITLSGMVTDYVTMVFLMLCVGVSIAAFHVPAPAMIARISGNRIGMGMSFYMFGGETARTIGPLIAVSAITWLTFEGVWRLSIIAWLTSAFLFVRLRHIDARANKKNNASLDSFWPIALSVFPQILFIFLARVPMLAAITIYLPTFMKDELDSSLWLGAGALTILEGAGATGIMFTGSLSDRFGRISMLRILLVAAPFLLFAFLLSPAWALPVVLILLGFTAITPAPVLMAIIQDYFPDHRAFGNGILMAINFFLRGVGIWVVGLLADQVGLTTAFWWTGFLYFLSIPAVMMLPKVK